MGRYGTSGGATFRVEGIEPADLHLHPEPVRRMYWRWIVELVLTAKDRELAAGLDRFGLMMVPLGLATRRHRRSEMGPADSNAPPLQPAHGASRTRSLFDGRAFPDRAEFFWRFDEFTGANWGRVLKFHARGAGGLPVRDVIGLSPQSLQWVRLQAMARWMTWLRQPVEPKRIAAMKPTTKTPKGWQIGLTRQKEVPKLDATGRTDLENFTFGIGATKEEVRRMIESGHFTGFRQLHTFRPGEGPSAAGTQAPPSPKPKPVPKPVPKPPAKPGPLGVPVSAGLDVQAAGKVGKQVNHAVEQIAKVHGDGALPKIPVKRNESANTNGTFRRGYDGKPLEIVVSGKGEWPALTMVHETGHFLDYAGIPMPHKIGDVRDFALDPRFKDWVKAIEESAAFKALKAVSQKTQVTVPTRAGATMTVNVDRTHTAYLLRWREIWARSYAQYVAHRSGDAEMMAQLDRRRDPASWYEQTYNSQWTNADFEPVAKAIDGIFKGLGWRK